MPKKGYTAINLPAILIEELKVWKMAFSSSYGRTVSYAEMIRGMLDSLGESEPGVVEELDRLVRKHPELEEKMANSRDAASLKKTPFDANKARMTTKKCN